ncbi:MAG TPA: zf-TFIIB domain-containing protein [Phycisphaerales bacterium]|nr:zf-TFIIB domain-containing protein [Phycisphaerales bacterium]
MSNDAAKSMYLLCPKDGAHMEKVAAGEFTLDRCTECGAIWFDAKELENLQRDKTSAAQVDVGGAARGTGPTLTKGLLCPRDGSPMKELAFPDQSHILAMRCGMCGGHLLDSGEFRDVASFTLGERIRAFFGK